MNVNGRRWIDPRFFSRKAWNQGSGRPRGGRIRPVWLTEARKRGRGGYFDLEGLENQKILKRLFIGLGNCADHGG